MSATKPLAVLLAALVVATGVGAAAGSTYDTGTSEYGIDATLDDGTVTVTVTGESASNATVYVDDEPVATTDRNGTATFERPEDDEFEVSVETDDAELKAEYGVEDGSLVLEKSEFEMEDDEAEDDEAESEDEKEESEDDEAEDDEAEDEEADENESESNGPPADAGVPEDAGPSDEADENESGERGPPADLPAQAADRASSVHDVIRSFLSGDVGNLGAALGGAN